MVVCVAGGLAGYRVVVVASATDPRIPRRRERGAAIPVIKAGFVVGFGPVPAAAGRTEIGIDTGGGFGARGGEYCVGSRANRVLVTACGTQWIS